MSKIMFKGREVVKVKTDKKFLEKCADCVGKEWFTDDCILLPACGLIGGNIVYQYEHPVNRKVSKRKVARCWILMHGVNFFCFETHINKVSCCKVYHSGKSAIRGARRFCAAIGYECEIVKGDK